ncbi:PepSY domain-containing protein [Sphingomonas psychrotolerans]|uniref:PepSY domain-containing protein n=1 Tax=Sphingomonas psychrotolerans TaxID=1327635 RepID=A0ABU3N2Y9_9SPHN|nr:PepSY-associated TM helix domain-containing protein [Sphingomonas psychrotolerans]MDT8758910.1 PepSY domain-containing protein [Sphingomonas psychrotolerans]
MKALDLIHRWTGGILGLVLAILGLSGAILAHKESWIALPHAGDARIGDPAVIAAATEKLFAAEPRPQSIVYAGDRFGLHQVRLPHGAGAYADQAGDIVTSWQSQWQRPELWIFDLHHHLFADDIGETVIGVAGLAAILFVVSGAILWWRTRKTFKFRLWPRRLSRPAIVMQHRDLGIMVAPLLLLSAVTGTMMIFKPFAALVIAPFSAPWQALAANAPPKVESGPLAARPDWRAIIGAAHARFPDAQIRILTLPRKPGDPITVRMKRAAEWLPNGRSLLAFDAGNGRLLGAKDALALPRGAQVFNGAYPLHAAKVGGLAWRLALTVSGLAMALLGSLTVWTFWFRRPRTRAL